MLKYPVSVFLDTNIFISARYDFSSSGVLGLLLKYIRKGKVKLYISSIVKNEIESHIEREISELVRSFKKTGKDVNKKISDKIICKMSVAYLFNKLDETAIKAEAVSIFEKYIADSKAVILDNNVDFNKIITDYFSGNPPFEVTENKKHEFPDAIMAAKLKSEFTRNKPVYIISGDNGFKKVFEDQEGFNTIESIKEMLDLISREDKIYSEITSFISVCSNKKVLCEKITDGLEKIYLDIDGNDYDRKGVIGGYDYDEVLTDNISEVDFEISSVDDIAETTVIITLSCKAMIAATCYYIDESNSIWDSEEKDYIFLKKGEVIETHEPNFDCDVTFLIKQDEGKVNFEIKTVRLGDMKLNECTRRTRKDVSSDFCD